MLCVKKWTIFFDIALIINSIYSVCDAIQVCILKMQLYVKRLYGSYVIVIVHLKGLAFYITILCRFKNNKIIIANIFIEWTWMYPGLQLIYALQSKNEIFVDKMLPQVNKRRRWRIQTHIDVQFLSMLLILYSIEMNRLTEAWSFITHKNH